MIDVVVLGKPGVGTSTLVSTLAAALQSPMSTDAAADLQELLQRTRRKLSLWNSHSTHSRFGHLVGRPACGRTTLGGIRRYFVIDSEPYRMMWRG